MKRIQGPLEKWLNPGVRQKENYMGLDSLVSKSKQDFKNDEDMSQEHKN